MSSIYHNVKNDKKCKAASGLSLAQFEELFLHFEKFYKPKQENPYPNTPKPVLTDKKEALFFILHYLKAYPTLENMGIYFDMDVKTVSNYLTYTKQCLKAALKEQDKLVSTLFDTQDDFDKVFENVGDIIIDCTEIPIQRPKDNDYQKFNYSGKKKPIQ